MSIKGSTSRHCYVLGCGNGDYWLQKWRQSFCEEHRERHDSDSCNCKPPFELFTFPSVKRKPERRAQWLKNMNRADEDRPYKLKEPKKDHRVCSAHFVDGKPTDEHPDPEVSLGYERKPVSESKVKRSERYVKRQKVAASKCSELATEMKECVSVTGSCGSLPERNTSALLTASRFIIYVLLSVLQTVKMQNKKLQLENLCLKNQMKLMSKKKTSSPTVANLILNKDADAQFYTGMDTIGLFRKLHKFVAPFVLRRWKGFKCISTKVRNFAKSPKKFGPKRKLNSEDEFLLTLMWLRLGLLKKDLADRFKISESLCSQIFNSWLTAMSKVLSHLTFWPSKEQVLASKPNRYKHLPDLRVIIDCSEIFIETPKDPRLQTATWSDYKHHNTAKFLIGVAPNSAITFCSNVFNGRASDKAVTKASGIYDLLEPYDMIQADKGFNIQDECAARLINLHVPPGKRGQAQMSVSANTKTSRVANLRILVEQVIRRLKSFRIIKHTVPISLVPSLDKILKVCCAFCNLKKPIYKD